MVRKIFQGRRKFLTIPLLAVLSLYFLPFAIGIALALLALKYIPQKFAKYAVIGVIALFTLPAGTGWVMGMTGEGTTPESEQEEVAGTTTVQDTPTPTAIPESTAKPTPSPTQTPTAIPTQTPIIPTPTPTRYIPPTAKPTVYVPPPAQQNNSAPATSNGGYSCNCSKTCTQISSCAEAQYQLNVCGCSVRDGDKDGIACDAGPLHCQN